MLVVFYNNKLQKAKCRSLSLLRTLSLLFPSSHFVVLLPSPPFPMHILRRDLDSYLPGSDSTVKDDNNGPIDYGKPGPHRFIGIAMTVGVIFLVLMAYLIFGKRPRRTLGKCLGGRREEIEEADIKQVSVGLETASYSSEEKHDVFRSISGAQVDAERRQSNRRQGHSHGQRRNGRRLSIGPSDRDVTISPRDAEWEHHTKESTSDKVSDLAEKLFLRSRLDQSNFLGSNSAKTRSSETTADISALRYLRCLASDS